MPYQSTLKRSTVCVCVCVCVYERERERREMLALDPTHRLWLLAGGWRELGQEGRKGLGEWSGRRRPGKELDSILEGAAEDTQVTHERHEGWRGGDREAAGDGLLTGRGMVPTKQLQCPLDLGRWVSSEHLSSQSRLERPLEGREEGGREGGLNQAIDPLTWSQKT